MIYIDFICTIGTAKFYQQILFSSYTKLPSLVSSVLIESALSPLPAFFLRRHL